MRTRDRRAGWKPDTNSLRMSGVRLPQQCSPTMQTPTGPLLHAVDYEVGVSQQQILMQCVFTPPWTWSSSVDSFCTVPGDASTVSWTVTWHGEEKLIPRRPSSSSAWGFASEVTQQSHDSMPASGSRSSFPLARGVPLGCGLG